MDLAVSLVVEVNCVIGIGWMDQNDELLLPFCYLLQVRKTCILRLYRMLFVALQCP